MANGGKVFGGRMKVRGHGIKAVDSQRRKVVGRKEAGGKEGQRGREN